MRFEPRLELQRFFIHKRGFFIGLWKKKFSKNFKKNQFSNIQTNKQGKHEISDMLVLEIKLGCVIGLDDRVEMR